MKLIKRVSYKNNVIFIEFNEDMDINVNEIDIEHSYLNFKNYAIEIEEKINKFPVGTKYNEVEFGFSVRFIIPSSFLKNIYDDANLHLGYVDKRKIFYIESAKGHILDICSISSIGKQIEELNLQNGVVDIIDKKTLKYLYSGENRFDNISIRDFFVLKESKSYYPSSIKKITSKEFILNFSELILNESNTSILLKLAKNPKTKDIYGFNIKGDIEIPIINLVPVKLKLFSFVNYQNKIAYFKLKFSKAITFFESNDFMIKYNNISKSIKALGINNDGIIIDICVENLDIYDVDNAIFEIFTAVKFEDVHTIDKEGRKVFIDETETFKMFKSFKVNWVLKDYNFSKSIISIQFNENILPKSLITDYSIFKNNIISWNGEKLTIKETMLKIEYEDQSNSQETILTLRLDKNDSFGFIVIKSKDGFVITNKNKISNTKPCQIYIQNNILFLEFDEEEEMYGILVFIDTIKYYPTINIQSLSENFIFYGYYPIGYYELNNIIYIEPIEDQTENPFKGGIVQGNYIIGLKNSKKFRYYGEDLVTTEINGFLKIVGILEIGESANLQNLKVLGTIIIDASRTNVTLDKVECLDNAEIKTH